MRARKVLESTGSPRRKRDTQMRLRGAPFTAPTKSNIHAKPGALTGSKRCLNSAPSSTTRGDSEGAMEAGASGSAGNDRS